MTFLVTPVWLSLIVTPVSVMEPNIYVMTYDVGQNSELRKPPEFLFRY